MSRSHGQVHIDDAAVRNVADDLLTRLTVLRNEYGPMVDHYFIGALSEVAGRDVCVEGAFVHGLAIAERCAQREVEHSGAPS